MTRAISNYLVCGCPRELFKKVAVTNFVAKSSHNSIIASRMSQDTKTNTGTNMTVLNNSHYCPCCK